jgi:hypothetical protein
MEATAMFPAVNLELTQFVAKIFDSHEISRRDPLLWIIV